jgi:methylmalonyl-CoA mutase N-terminal domain/subunit
MFDKKELEKVAKAKAEWDEKGREYNERDYLFETVSGRPVAPLYTPADVDGLDYDDDLGVPGEFPFTRGVQANMYRPRPPLDDAPVRRVRLRGGHQRPQ